MASIKSLEEEATELARKWFYKEHTVEFYDDVVTLAELFETNELQVIEAINKATAKLAPTKSKSILN